MQGCCARKKDVGNRKAPKRLVAIIKQLQTHFKANHEKGVGMLFSAFPLHYTPACMKLYSCLL